MDLTRRSFLRLAAAGSCLGLASPQAPGSWLRSQSAASGVTPKKILILGGTGFLGSHIVEFAQKRGHTLTLFNRGQTNPQFFPDVEKLKGDRDGKLQALEGRSFDAVVDTSGHVPRIVRASAELLRNSVQHYVFISTIAVYAHNLLDMDETASIARIEDETVEQITAANLGALKALCERAAEQAMPGRVASIRPGWIVGPGDQLDQFTYWPVRIDRGGEVLAPGNPEDPVQFIDVRDLAEWIVRVVEQRTVGTYIAAGPGECLGFGDLLEECKAVSGSDAELTWVDAAFLEKHRMRPFSDLPMKSPAGAYATDVSVKKAIAKGLTFRPLATTIEDTLAWWKSLPKARRTLKTGMKPEREAEVLKAWHESR